MTPRKTTTIEDTAVYTDRNIFAVDIETDAVFTSVDGTLTGYATKTYAAGRTLFFHAKGFQLASGRITIYEN